MISTASTENLFNHVNEDDIVQEHYPLMDSENGSFESPNPYENFQDITRRIGVPVGKQLVVRIDYFAVDPYMDGVELVVDEKDIYYFTGLPAGFYRKEKQGKNHRQTKIAKDEHTGFGDEIDSEISDSDNDDTEINDQYGGNDFDNFDSKNSGYNTENKTDAVYSSRDYIYDYFYSAVAGQLDWYYDEYPEGYVVDEIYTNPDGFVVCAEKNVKFRFYSDYRFTYSGFKFDLNYQNLDSDWCQATSAVSTASTENPPDHPPDHLNEDEIVQDLMDSGHGSFESPHPYANSQDRTVKIEVPIGKQLVVRIDFFTTKNMNDGVELAVDETDFYFFSGFHDFLINPETVLGRLKNVSPDQKIRKEKRKKYDQQMKIHEDEHSGSGIEDSFEISDTDIDDTENDDQYGGFDYENTERF